MRYVYRIENLHCASCAAKMERAISKIGGVRSAKITFMTSKLAMEADESGISDIEKEVERAIKKIESQVKLVKV